MFLICLYVFPPFHQDGFIKEICLQTADLLANLVAWQYKFRGKCVFLTNVALSKWKETFATVKYYLLRRIFSTKEIISVVAI